MTQKKKDFSGIGAILAGTAVIVAAAAPAFYNDEVAVNGLTEEQVQEAMQKAIALQGLDVNMTEGPRTIAIYEEIFEEDAWEAEAEVLAIEELEDDDYESLFDFMTSANMSIEDEDDINKVIVKDIDFIDADVDEKDMTVNLELKVYYENLDGESKKKYIDANVTIIDGEVEDIVFSKA